MRTRNSFSVRAALAIGLLPAGSFAGTPTISATKSADPICHSAVGPNAAPKVGQWLKTHGTSIGLTEDHIPLILPTGDHWLNSLARDLEDCCQIQLGINSYASSAFEKDVYLLNPRAFALTNDPAAFRARLAADMGLDLSQSYKSYLYTKDPSFLRKIQAQMKITDTGYRMVGTEIVFTGEGTSELAALAREVKKSNGVEVHFRESNPYNQAPPKLRYDSDGKTIYLNRELAFTQTISSDVDLERMKTSLAVEKSIAEEGLNSPFSGTLTIKKRYRTGTLTGTGEGLLANPELGYAELMKSLEQKVSESDFQAYMNQVADELNFSEKLYRQSLDKLKAGEAKVSVKNGKIRLSIKPVRENALQTWEASRLVLELDDPALLDKAEYLSGVTGLINRFFYPGPTVSRFNAVAEPFREALSIRFARLQKQKARWDEVYLKALSLQGREGWAERRRLLENLRELFAI
ncbi:MAG: hypothetical protein JST04_02195 [Bdellovibrionales bacterium]|nr:hypothetical protein [Bdellovibrionales bacterium]